MERVEVELFTDRSNNAVARMPGRRFPGVLIQGDSLSILRADAAEVAALCADGELEDARETAELLVAEIDGILLRYTDALETHGIARPF
ncbi:hypothetical protein G5C51_13615 [Streptomyces sp. A7024]|uniref:Uncharacterized protein n=1 Tax=Streptomyces coryli TaxID=1128680 RepID=A0A6G4U118_9ACTN|nr:hypothetical protein [Streptomyces coryli]NGN64931.1 hypothetical protein [Streptomyces coryli]